MLPKTKEGFTGSINCVQATPVCACLLFLRQRPGAPDAERWMTTRLLTIVLVLATMSGCSASRGARWNPDAAVADAERDISSGHIRFAYVGGFLPQAPGIPEDNYGTIYRYGKLKVGPQGCCQDEYSAERKDYARRYNEIMWGYVCKQL